MMSRGQVDTLMVIHGLRQLLISDHSVSKEAVLLPTLFGLVVDELLGEVTFDLSADFFLSACVGDLLYGLSDGPWEHVFADLLVLKGVHDQRVDVITAELSAVHVD
jgi:hypothetical protein